MTGRITPAQRQAVQERDGRACVRCGTSQGLSAHHRLPGQMGGRSGPVHNGGANVITLCGDGVRGCHGWVESNRDVARLQGWLVPSWAGVSPTNWPVHLPQGWFQPCDGYWEPADPHPLQVDGPQRPD